jgi:hypothetical protein
MATYHNTMIFPMFRQIYPWIRTKQVISINKPFQSILLEMFCHPVHANIICMPSLTNNADGSPLHTLDNPTENIDNAGTDFVDTSALTASVTGTGLGSDEVEVTPNSFKTRLIRTENNPSMGQVLKSEKL